jgi:hypothetical protein
VIGLKDYLVLTCGKLLVCTLLSKLCLIADLIFSLCSHGDEQFLVLVMYAVLT